MGFGFHNVEHVFASIARDTVRTATIISAVESRVEKAAPEIEAITGAIYPPAVLIERAAFGLLGLAASSSNTISDATKAHGLNIALDEESIKELQQIAKFLTTRAGSLESSAIFEDPTAAAAPVKSV
jgi:hypothetical protein